MQKPKPKKDKNGNKLSTSLNNKEITIAFSDDNNSKETTKLVVKHHKSSSNQNSSKLNTSRTVSANMLKWSLARSIQMGIVSSNVFQREMHKV